MKSLNSSFTYSWVYIKGLIFTEGETEQESWDAALPNSTAPLYLSTLPLPPGLDDFHLSIHSDMAAIVKAMASPESGLEVRDRMWLKITIPNAFIGERTL